MKYTTQTLIDFCNDNNIKLSNEYNSIKINRDSYIEGECINKICCNKFIFLNFLIVYQIRLFYPSFLYV